MPLQHTRFEKEVGVTIQGISLKKRLMMINDKMNVMNKMIKPEKNVSPFRILILVL